jgi:uncharacterized membrane protein
MNAARCRPQTTEESELFKLRCLFTVERYARGEISREEYRQKKRDLER